MRFVAEVYCRLLEADRGPPVVNICSGRSVALRSIMEEMQQLSGHECVIEPDAALMRRQEIDELRGDDRLLRDTLPGLGPPPALRDTLKWMYQHMLATG